MQIYSGECVQLYRDWRGEGQLMLTEWQKRHLKEKVERFKIMMDQSQLTKEGN